MKRLFLSRLAPNPSRLLSRDLTYIWIPSNFNSLYRPVDKAGNTVDFMLSEKRNEPSARPMFLKVIGSSETPHTATMDKTGAVPGLRFLA